jgi:hypothetical protein
LAPPYEDKNKKIKLLPLETGASVGVIAYLKVEKPRFLFIEGSTGVVVAAAVAAAALPDASTACADAFVARAAPSVDCLAAGASAPAPGTCPSAASAALGEGAQDPTPRGEPAPHHSLLPPPATTSTPRLSEERDPAVRVAGTPRPSVPGAPAAESSAPSCAPPALDPAAAPRVRMRGLGAWAGWTTRRPRPPFARNCAMSDALWHIMRE